MALPARPSPCYPLLWPTILSWSSRVSIQLPWRTRRCRLAACKAGGAVLHQALNRPHLHRLCPRGAANDVNMNSQVWYLNTPTSKAPVQATFLPAANLAALVSVARPTGNLPQPFIVGVGEAGVYWSPTDVVDVVPAQASSPTLFPISVATDANGANVLIGGNGGPLVLSTSGPTGAFTTMNTGTTDNL